MSETSHEGHVSHVVLPFWFQSFSPFICVEGGSCRARAARTPTVVENGDK